MIGIIRNAMKTPDGTILESRHRHDFKSHKDANGKEYIIDGGQSYLRRSAWDDQVDLSVSLMDGHDRVRNALEWGTYGVTGDMPLTYLILKDMDTDHIETILELQNPVASFKEAFKNELSYRKETGQWQTAI